MFDLFLGRWMQKVVALSIIFWILTTLDLHWDDTRWWAILILMMVIDHISGVDGEHRGVSNTLALSRDKLLKVKDFMDSVERGGDHSVEDLDKILKNKDQKDE
jgi:hypothetical protein